MAAVTPTSTIRYSNGDHTLIRFVLSSVNTGDTLATGLGGTIIDFWGNQTSITTQASTGIAISNSSGTLTLKPGENSNAWTIFVLAQV